MQKLSGTYFDTPDCVAKSATWSCACNAQGFRAIMTHCLAQMQDNESGGHGGTDPESVHQVCVGTPDERRRVRIAAKKDAMGSSRGPIGRRATRSVERLSALQDALGWLNDAAVADGLLGQIGKGHPEPAGSAEFAGEFLRGHTEQEVRELASLGAKFSATKPPG